MQKELTEHGENDISLVIESFTEMKQSLLTFLLAVSFAAFSSAATNVSYSASADPNFNPDANSNTVDVWSVTFSSPGSSSVNGSFLGNSGNNAGGSGAGAGASAWGLYASGGNSTTATHNFLGGNLLVGQTVSMQFDNGYLSNTTGAGINLLSGASVVFSLSFTGGDASYKYSDATGSHNLASTFTGDGFTFALTLTSSTAYAASVSGGINETWSGTVAPGGLSGIQFFNRDAGSGGNFDVFANNLSVVPEPSSVAGSIALLAGGIGALIYRRKSGRVDSAVQA